jgi:hypothetical protein
MYRFLIFFYLFAIEYGISQKITFHPKIAVSSFKINVENSSLLKTGKSICLGSDVKFGSNRVFVVTGVHSLKDELTIDIHLPNVKVNFIQIPSQVGYYITKKPFFNGAFNAFIKGGVTNNIYLKSNSNAINFDKLFSKFNMAASVGFGIDLFRYLSLGVDYDHGLTNYFNLEPYVGRKRSLALSMGLNF